VSVPDFGEIAEQLRRATVLIRCRNSGNGSGIMWSKEGSIVSNAHVISSSRPTVQLWDGREFEATVISRDPRRDLAALRISASGLPAAAARDAFSVRPGELAIAIGNPLGFVGAMATGVIHAIGPIRGLGSQTWLQAGIRLAPGNSGGPLADGRGRVIGVNTMVAGRLALAVPSNAVWDFLTAGSLDSWLGVTVRPVRVPGVKGGENTFGLLVVEIGMDSPAANASLLAGDILLGTEAGPFKSLDDFRAELRNAAARTIRFEFLRGDYQRRRRVTVQLGKQSPWRGGVAA
jgi:serine protease Do